MISKVCMGLGKYLSEQFAWIGTKYFLSATSKQQAIILMNRHAQWYADINVSSSIFI